MRISIAVGLAIALFGAAPVYAGEPIDRKINEAIRDEGLKRSEALEVLFHLSDVIGPRVTGSPALKAANRWTRDRLAALGLSDARLEAFEFGQGWTCERSEVRLLQPALATLTALPIGWSPGTNGVVTGPAIRLRADNEAGLAAYRGRLKGKIVLTEDARVITPSDKPLFTRFTAQELEELAQMPPARAAQEDLEAQHETRRRKLHAFLHEEQALAWLEPSRLDGGAVQVRGVLRREDREAAGVPHLFVAAEHYNRVARLIERKQDVVLEIDLHTRTYSDDLMAYNTLAEIPGGDKKREIVLLGAHLDSWHAGTGASDNAAGCAIVMEAARILSRVGVKPRRTIRVALWVGEEQGLLGSAAYVDAHLARRRTTTGPAPSAWHALPDYERFSAYFNVDGGGGRIRGIFAQENAAVISIFTEWLAPLGDLGATLVSPRSPRRTDHMSFDQVGLPGFYFLQDRGEYATRSHHSSLDLADRVPREDLAQAAVIVAVCAYQAAMRDELMPRKPQPAPAAK
ncbi:MAG: M20/M25/M40 family metallo-hydrolase [Vicinamibacteria bacterium]|jgi:hypothetical protein|nr:M20/M25/M40 family metallo-hydrolase [Vicinamibacteria bacterium]